MITTIPLDEKDHPEIKQILMLTRRVRRRVRKTCKHTVCIEVLSNVNGSEGMVKRIGRTEVPDSAIVNNGGNKQ